MNKSLIGVTIMVVSLGIATCAALVKTRTEVVGRTADRWTGANRIESDRLLNKWNPDLLVPSARNIIDGVPAQPMEKEGGAISTAKSELTLRWGSIPFACEMTNERAARENGEQFADRAGSDATAMLRAFPAR